MCGVAARNRRADSSLPPRLFQARLITEWLLILRNSVGGGWSTKGCRRSRYVDETVTCECDHLTNFAVLLDTSGISSVSKHGLQSAVKSLPFWLFCAIHCILDM